MTIDVFRILRCDSSRGLVLIIVVNRAVRSWTMRCVAALVPLLLVTPLLPSRLLSSWAIPTTSLVCLTTLALAQLEG